MKKLKNAGIAAAIALIVAAGAASGCGGKTMTVKIERKTCAAPDGVEIVYSAAGKGEPALVFVHGGLANRAFWDGQLRAFAGRHRTIALDLAGHGESGVNRTKWGLPEFGADVRPSSTPRRSGRSSSSAIPWAVPSPSKRPSSFPAASSASWASTPFSASTIR